MKKFTKCIFLFILILMMSFSTSKTVLAAFEGNAQNNTSSTSSCRSGWCWSGKKWLRISFYDSDGNKIGYTLNFYSGAAPTTQSVYINAELHTSKLDYMENPSRLNSYGSWTNVDLVNCFDASLNFNILSSSSSNVFKDMLGIESLEGLKQLISPYNEKFFGSSTTIEQLISQPEKYYMVIEPTTTIYKVGGKRYYGSYAELQNIYNDIGDTGEFDRIRTLFDDTTGHLSKYIYLSPDKTIGGEDDSSFASTLNTIKDNGDVKDVNNQYGIGVAWFGEYVPEECECCEANEESGWNPATGNCEPTPPDYSEFPECTVKPPTIAPCGDRIEIEYNNCLMEENIANHITYGEDDPETATVESEVDVCKLICDEKYYINTYPLVNSFSPAQFAEDGTVSNYVLAGTYISIEGPVVYHKKTCSYLYNGSNLENRIREDYSKRNDEYDSGNWSAGCTYKESYSCCGDYDEEGNCTDWDTCYRWVTAGAESECRQYWKHLEETTKGQCETLEGKLEGTGMSFEEVKALEDITQQKANSLTLVTGTQNFNSIFSNYTLKIDDTNPSAVIREPSSTFEDYAFGYKNSFYYSLANNVNKHISMETIYDNNVSPTPVGSDRYYENATAMGTTPINLQTGTYSFKMDYSSAFSDSFKAVVENNSSIKFDSTTLEGQDITGKQCNFTVKGRNIKTLCTEGCGDPDKEFKIPNIRMEYRPISLTDPFLRKDGTDRKEGYNWPESDVTKYIKENRGISTNALYFDKEPLYVIDLDAAKINAIKDYNDSNAYDDFTLSCTDGTGEECISNFLRGSLTGFTTNLLTSGECADTSAVGYDFYSCADKVKIIF